MLYLKKTWFQSRHAENMTRMEQEVIWNLLKAVCGYCLRYSRCPNDFSLQSSVCSIFKTITPFFQAGAFQEREYSQTLMGAVLRRVCLDILLQILIGFSTSGFSWGDLEAGEPSFLKKIFILSHVINVYINYSLIQLYLVYYIKFQCCIYCYCQSRSSPLMQRKSCFAMDIFNFQICFMPFCKQLKKKQNFQIGCL